MLDDRDFVSHQLEAMKLAQASLQQIMTLSAGGLAIFFGFIGKAPFVASFEILGTGVVLAWIISLASAAYAHRAHATLFVKIARLHAVARGTALLDSLPEEVDAELKTNPNQQAVLDRARKRVQEERARVGEAVRSFEAVYFPTQDKVLRATRVALAMLVFGFVELGFAYVFSRHAT